MKHLLIVCSLFFSMLCNAQAPCEYVLKPDSCVLQTPKQKELVEMMETKIKNNYLVQFIKQDKKNYLNVKCARY